MKKLIFLLILASNFSFAQQPFYEVTAGNGNGIRLWQNDSYKIHMGNSFEYLFGPVQDYSIKTNMSGGTPNRGWTWGVSGQTPVMAINTSGSLQVASTFKFNDKAYFGNWILGASGLWPINPGLYYTGGDEIFGFASTGGQISVQIDGGFRQQETGQVNYFLDKVGIGTTSPSSKLHVLSTTPIGAALNSEVLITRFSTNVANQQSLDLKLRNYSTSDNYWWGNGLRLQRNIDDVLNSCYIDFGASETTVGGGSNELGFGVGNTEYMRISSGGKVGIGTTSPDAPLAVNGQIHATEVKVTTTVPGPDYVFDNDYALPSLDSIKSYLDKNKHLPEVPSAATMEKEGIKLGEMNMLLLKKIEELTLYVIELKKRDEAQQKEIEQLKNK